MILKCSELLTHCSWCSIRFIVKLACKNLIFSQIWFIYIFSWGSPFCSLFHKNFSVSLLANRICFLFTIIPPKCVFNRSFSFRSVFQDEKKKTRITTWKTKQCFDAKSQACNYKLGISEESSIFNPLRTFMSKAISTAGFSF